MNIFQTTYQKKNNESTKTPPNFLVAENFALATKRATSFEPDFTLMALTAASGVVELVVETEQKDLSAADVAAVIAAQAGAV